MFGLERRYRQRCIDEILVLAHDKGIQISHCYLHPQRNKSPRDRVLNVVVDELELLNRQRKSYRVHFFVADGNKPFPDEYVRAVSEPPYDNRGVIGVTPNPQYEQALGKYRQAVSRVVSELERELTPEWERRYEAALQEWREAWAGEYEPCPECGGQGTHGTGQSGIGDVYCEQCGGSGTVCITPPRWSGEPPAEPERSQFRSIPQDLLDTRLKNLGLDIPRDMPEAFTVYARFEVE